LTILHQNPNQAIEVVASYKLQNKDGFVISDQTKKCRSYKSMVLDNAPDLIKERKISLIKNIKISNEELELYRKKLKEAKV
jgi:hypothetical protein